MSKIIYAVDEFGEILTNGVVYTEEELKQQDELRQQRREYFRVMKHRQQLLIDFQDILGEFFFINYNRLIDKLDGDTATAFRYIYLCTFADRNGLLIYRGKPILHKNFQSRTRLNRNVLTELISKLILLELLIEKDKHYYINKDYYIRNVKLPSNFKGSSSRIIDRGIRELYDQATPRNHKALGRMVQLLPYINKHNNILCTPATVYEYDHTKVDPLTALEICEICGYSPENSDVFIKELNSFRIGGLPFVRRIIDDKLVCYIVNPYVVYMGSRNDNLKWTFKLFDLNRHH